MPFTSKKLEIAQRKCSKCESNVTSIAKAGYPMWHRNEKKEWLCQECYTDQRGTRRNRLYQDFEYSSNPTVHAYAAGLLDGEGYIGVSYSKDSGTYSLRVKLVQADNDIPTFLKAHYMGNIAIEIRKDRNRIFHRWSVGADQAAMALLLMLPYLRLKKRQALLALDFQQKLVKLGAFSRHAEKNSPEQKQYSDAISHLNTKGRKRLDAIEMKIVN